MPLYEMAVVNTDHFLEFGVGVFDEAHRLKKYF
jgi:hypothetical protein